jgi:hypothetical protein
MRIRNKLITVQLIMAATLFLCIAIFSSLIVEANKVKDSRITLNKMSMDIFEIESTLKIVLNKRDLPGALSIEIDDLSKEISRNFLKIEGSKITNNLRFRPRIGEVKQAWLNLDTRGIIRLKNLLFQDFTQREVDIIKNLE